MLRSSTLDTDSPTSPIALDTYRYLVLWAKAASCQDESLELIRSLASFMVSLLSNTRLLGPVTQFVYEVLTEYPSFFTQEIYSLISVFLLGPLAYNWLQQLSDGDFEEEPLWIGKILVAYGEVRVENLTDAACLENSSLLKLLLLPLSCPGVPTVDDPIASPALEFWSNFVETARDQYEDRLCDPDYWLGWNDGIFKNLLLCIKPRIQHPPPEQWRTFTPDEKKLFNYFRSDARDLLSFMEAFFGVAMTMDLASNVLNDVEQRNWLKVEASLFCLNSIISQVNYEDNDLRKITDTLFRPTSKGTSVIEKIRAATTEVPVVVFKEVISLFSAVESLAQNDSNLLLMQLQCLADWFALRALAMPAATVFASLCLHARETIVQAGKGSHLLELLQGYAASPTREFAVQEKLSGAVAAIAQTYAANDAEQAKMILDALLTVVDGDIKTCLDLLATDSETAKNFGLCALRCLENMGKAFRLPEIAIDLYEEEQNQPQNYWSQHPNETASFQNKILSQCTAVLEIFSGPEEVVAICHILKSGYTESVDGPFVFPLEATVTLVKACQLSTPSIGEVFKNVSVLLEKNKFRRGDERVVQFARECLQHVQRMIVPYFENDPGRDPEVAALVISFLKSYTPAFNDVLVLENSQFPVSFDFALACLGSSEILPKQSAALFWVRRKHLILQVYANILGAIRPRAARH